MNVFEKALERIEQLYTDGDVVISFSAGKDSGVVLELCIMVAEKMGKLPVKVIIRDEEIMVPGTYEYAERVYKRPEIDMRWIIAGQPIVNIFSRQYPYFWVFDPDYEDVWVRRPPEWAIRIKDQSIENMLDRSLWGIGNDVKLYQLTGIRASESLVRKLSIHSKKGFICRRPSGKAQSFLATPIYDWQDGDVWLFYKMMQCDMNEAYQIMYRYGIPIRMMRVAPLTMSIPGIKNIRFIKDCYPNFFTKLMKRLDGIGSVANFGEDIIIPHRRVGETYREMYYRVNIEESPKWIKERAILTLELCKKRGYKLDEIPEIKGNIDDFKKRYCWREMVYKMYYGDPFCLFFKTIGLPYLEPETIKPGSGRWDGKPTF